MTPSVDWKMGAEVLEVGDVSYEAVEAESGYVGVLDS